MPLAQKNADPCQYGPLGHSSRPEGTELDCSPDKHVGEHHSGLGVLGTWGAASSRTSDFWSKPDWVDFAPIALAQILIPNR